MNSLDRIANALEHLAYPQVTHEECNICSLKKKPIKKMKPSTVLESSVLARREAEIRHQKMLHGPEQPTQDMFRYRELNRNT